MLRMANSVDLDQTAENGLKCRLLSDCSWNDSVDLDRDQTAETGK